jgi:sterol desaturase/sphingolipid hydroxylase (fatty acid hydroxylase superfamily)
MISTYPLALLGSVLVFELARRNGWPLALTTTLLGAFALIAAAVLERLRPHRRDWQIGPITTDATSAVVIAALVDPLVKLLIEVGAAGIAPMLGGALAWPASGLPFWVQAALALVWVEFAKYWSHRWHHEWPLLWAFHAVHHNARRVYWLNGLRIHPLNHVVNTVAAMLPLAVLGAPGDVLLGVVAITLPVQMFQHANVRLKHGGWNRVFSTHEAHRLHHSRQVDEANANYGSAFLLWDHVFGTWRPPRRSSSPSYSVGVADGAGAPQETDNYWRQLTRAFTAFSNLPCCPRCC